MADLSGIRIGMKARALMAALALGGALLTLAPGQAQARPIDSGARCFNEDFATGHMTFYLPGETMYILRTRYVCNEYGDWNIDEPRTRSRGLGAR